MADDKPKRGRPKKARQQLVETPEAFLADEEAGITEMQASFLCIYTEFTSVCGHAAKDGGYALEDRGDEL
jgi:hypothetical protein